MGRHSKRGTAGEQLELPKTRKRDKNHQFRGGARKGAGRPKLKRRTNEPHAIRPDLVQTFPVHVVLRVLSGVIGLRSLEGMIAIRHAMDLTLKLGDAFRIVHYSIQRNHIHLIVEAVNKAALTRGMQTFEISCAKQLNLATSVVTGKRRRGAVFTDRYFARILRTPREVRNLLAYVLNNWRHHGMDLVRLRRPWKVDPFSSALAFDGWKELGDGRRYAMPSDFRGASVWLPSSWLLRVGWRKHGLVSTHEVPGKNDE